MSSTLARYVGAVCAVAAGTALLAVRREHISSATVGLGFLLVVLFVAILWGSKPALLASLLGMLSFNFFFLPPFYTLTIADPQNWVTVTAFFITAVAVGQLSARARRRAEEAEAGRREIRRLYEELRDAFERASEAEALRRNERLKSALLDAVTHDLRTPLTAIKASATLLLEDREMTEQIETLAPEEQQALHARPGFQSWVKGYGLCRLLDRKPERLTGQSLFSVGVWLQLQLIVRQTSVCRLGAKRDLWMG